MRMVLSLYVAVLSVSFSDGIVQSNGLAGPDDCKPLTGNGAVCVLCTGVSSTCAMP